MITCRCWCVCSSQKHGDVVEITEKYDEENEKKWKGASAIVYYDFFYFICIRTRRICCCSVPYIFCLPMNSLVFAVRILFLHEEQHEVNVRNYRRNERDQLKKDPAACSNKDAELEKLWQKLDELEREEQEMENKLAFCIF